MRRGWPVVCAGLVLAAFLLRSAWSPVARPIPSRRERSVPSTVAEARSTRGDDMPISAPTKPREKKPLVQSHHACRGSSEESVVLRSLGWLLQAQNEDGSWGDGLAFLDGHPVDGVAMTSLALLAFLGAGYSHTSKDMRGDIRIGDAVRKGVRWLLTRQREDGSFLTAGDAILAQAMGALALNEMYGLTGSNHFVEPAQRATDGLARAQAPDGSWSGAYRSAWSAMALASARISELRSDEDVRGRARAYAKTQLQSGPNLPAMVEGVFFGRGIPPEEFESTVAALSDSPPREERPDATYWYWGALALYQVDGPKGEKWKSWSGALKETLSRAVQPDGHWPGSSPNDSLLKTSLATLSSEIYYRYANAVGVQSQ